MKVKSAHFLENIPLSLKKQSGNLEMIGKLLRNHHQ